MNLSSLHRLDERPALPSQLFHCLSAIIAARLVANEQPFVVVCEKMTSHLRRAPAGVDAIGKLAGKSLRLDSTSMNEFVLLENESEKKSQFER